MTVYNLVIKWEGVDRVLSVAFVNPPIRRDVDKLVGNQWRALPQKLQDDAWEFVLIADMVPEIPWLGKIEGFYGSIECAAREVINNDDPKMG